MNEIGHFKVPVLYSGDVTGGVDHLHVNWIHLVCFSYIVIDDTAQPAQQIDSDLDKLFLLFNLYLKLPPLPLYKWYWILQLAM
jgi:hypothetical protein